MMRCVRVGILFLSIVGTGCAAPPQKLIPYDKLLTEYQILGETHRPLGEMVTVQGEVVEGPYKGFEGGPNIRVRRINGRATQEIIQIKLRPYFEEEVVKSLKVGKTYELRGYEKGGFVGVPDAVFKEGGTIVQTSSFYFMVTFIVTKSKEIDAIHFVPGDFIDRFALIEGTARTENGKGMLVGESWKLIVQNNAGWPAHIEGKPVEAEGVIRKPGIGSQAYTLEQPKSRLIELKDQVGRQVELVGEAWSMNGFWWLSYRGVDMYVEDMAKLPGWTGNNHGCRVIISGILDERVVPVVDPARVKPDPVTHKNFIVHHATWRPVQQPEGP